MPSGTGGGEEPPTEYGDGEFERLFAEKPSIVARLRRGAGALAAVLGVRATTLPQPTLAQDAEARWEALDMQVVRAHRDGRADAAILPAEHALALARQAFGAKDRRTLRSLNNLTVPLRGQGRHAEAEPLLHLHGTVLSPEQAKTIAHNARLVTEQFTEITGKNLPPSRAGVVFLDEFIEIERQRGDLAEGDTIIIALGCYLGEALIAELGGRWIRHPERGLVVDLPPNLEVYPLARVSKRFANGIEDSLVPYFDLTVEVATGRRRSGPG